MANENEDDGIIRDEDKFEEPTVGYVKEIMIKCKIKGDEIYTLIRPRKYEIVVASSLEVVGVLELIKERALAKMEAEGIEAPDPNNLTEYGKHHGDYEYQQEIYIRIFIDGPRVNYKMKAINISEKSAEFVGAIENIKNIEMEKIRVIRNLSLKRMKEAANGK